MCSLSVNMSIVLEYACSSFHTTLTLEQSGMLERLQRISLKVILGLITTSVRDLKYSIKAQQ